MEAYLLQVKDAAAFGMHTVTVTNGKTGDDMLTQDLMFYVAGPPKMYKVEGPDAIPLRSRGTFTVTAVDENDGVPHFITVDDEMTMDNDERTNRVMVDAIYGTVRGVDRDGYLMLDTKTGMGTFTFTLPRTEVASGDPFTIFVGTGDMQVEKMVYAGEAPPEENVPGMPMSVMAEAMGHDTIKVTWAAPSDDGNSAITGYIIERRYEGDMMMDIPSDGYNAGAGGATFAFSNHMEWWETLNCKGMLAAAGSDADPTMDSDDKSMYCAHYAMTAPTNMAGTIMAGDATDMAIKALFEKRYIMDYRTDAMTMMHSDMGLMPETEYTYRVSAVNSVGRSMWSEAAMATTNPEVLMAPMNVATGLNSGGSVVVTWDAVGGADGYVIIAININDVAGDTVSTAVNEPDRESFALSGLTSGATYNIFVASFNKATPEGKLSASIMVMAN